MTGSLRMMHLSSRHVCTVTILIALTVTCLYRTDWMQVEQVSGKAKNTKRSKIAFIEHVDYVGSFLNL